MNENDTVATDEIQFGDNDRLAALVAHLVHADLLVLLSDVEGLFDGDPRRPGAALLSDVAGPADLDGVTLGKPGGAGIGSGGMVTKVEAARIATGAGIPVVLASAARATDALAGAAVGTRFAPPVPARRPDCCGWRTRPPREARCGWTPGPLLPSWTGACRCFPPASPASMAPSRRAIRWTYWTKTVTRWPAAW